MRSKKGSDEATIATVEVAYNLELPKDQWFPNLLEASLPMLDHGLGVGGLVAVKAPTPGPPIIETMHVARGPEDLVMRHGAAMDSLPVEQTHEQTVTGPFVLSEKTANHPEMAEIWRTFFDGAEDAIGYMTVDTDGRGIHVLAPTPEIVRLNSKERARWEMIAAHVASGVRLRNALALRREPAEDALPFGAEAVIDPKRFSVSEAEGAAESAEVLEALRRAAIAVDRARVSGRNDGESEAALAEWWALIRGRWSMVDWFDSDSRRYVLAVPNPPRVPNPRGVSEREQQVLAFAALGDSHKMIAYRLGLSRSRVTTLLNTSKRKLGVKTQAELVEKLRALTTAVHTPRSKPTTH